MDEKIKDKEESNKEKERLHHEQLKQAKEKKIIIEESKLEQSKLQNKKRKQQLKDQRKSLNKKIQKNVNTNKKEGIKISNLRDIPANCKHLVEEDDVLYVVPGIPQKNRLRPPDADFMGLGLQHMKRGFLFFCRK